MLDSKDRGRQLLTFPLGVVPFDDPTSHGKIHLDNENRNIYEHKNGDIDSRAREDDSSKSVVLQQYENNVLGEDFNLNILNSHLIKNEVNDDQGKAYPDERHFSSEDEDGNFFYK